MNDNGKLEQFQNRDYIRPETFKMNVKQLDWAVFAIKVWVRF